MLILLCGSVCSTLAKRWKVNQHPRPPVALGTEVPRSSSCCLQRCPCSWRGSCLDSGDTPQTEYPASRSGPAPLSAWHPAQSSRLKMGEKKRQCFLIFCTVSGDAAARWYSLLPYPSLAHSGADKEDVEPSGDEGVVRSRRSNSCTFKGNMAKSEQWKSES